MIRHYLISAICCLLPYLSSGQEVWPGDANNNGVVNGVDLLYWGQAFGSTGPARASTSTDWAAQTLSILWAQSFPSGLNYAYADCNGDGIVDEDDYDLAIEENLGLERVPRLPDGYANATPGNGPALRLETSATIVEPGAIFDVDLFLDTNDGPVNDFYGIALTLSYSTGLLEGDDGPNFDFSEDTWLDSGDDDTEAFYVDNDGAGTAELAFTRTNQESVMVGTAPIGRFQVIVEDIIIGLEVDTFTITIDSVMLVGLGLNPIATTPDTLQVLVVKDSTWYAQLTSTQAPARLADEIRVFPNPVRDVVQIASPLPLQQVFLIDALGKQWPLPVSKSADQQWQVSLPPRLRAGLYCLRIKTAAGEYVKKIMLVP